MQPAKLPGTDGNPEVIDLGRGKMRICTARLSSALGFQFGGKSHQLARHDDRLVSAQGEIGSFVTPSASGAVPERQDDADESS